MRFRLHAICVALLVALAAAPASASVQSGDPDQGSPSGVIYEIPLDNARRDAAPSRGGEGSRGSEGAASPIRSENGFGSSSAVPGARVAGGSSAREAGKGSGKKRGGSGGSASPKAPPPAMAPDESLGAARNATITPSPSKPRAYLLLALALAVAAGIGVAGRYVARRR